MSQYRFRKTRSFILGLLLAESLATRALAVQEEEVDRFKQEAMEEAETIHSLIGELSRRLWEYAEVGMEETRSAALLSESLEESGFVVERGLAELPSSFVATFGSGPPVIGILAEYDALPGVGNEPVPEKRIRTDGVTSGHGCGHNLFGAGSVGGAIALKNVLTKNDLSGTIKLFGTPAEEPDIGKLYMAKAGVFDGLDAVLEWHPSTQNAVGNGPGLALNNFEVEFFGQAAHASADPWNGLSALDAVEMMMTGINLLREHMLPTARIHYVVTHGGEAPNVVPDYAKMWLNVREATREGVDQIYDRVLKIAEAAALATGTTHKVTLIAGLHEYLLNRPLQEALQANLEWVEGPRFSEEEQEFARTLQRYLKIEEKGFNQDITSLSEVPDPPTGGSTDVAEVSRIAPTAGFAVTSAASGIPWHSWAATACHGTEASYKSAVVAAQVIATTGIDLLMRPMLIEEARAFFEKATGGKPYVSPIPADQHPPKAREKQ